MNHKASATCSNGHTFEFGTCQEEVKKFFGGTKICESKGFEEINSNEVRCMGCKIIYSYKICPQCNEKVPISSFKKKGFYAKLG